ncbi:MAG: cytochrome ubiquinol oxidase subunit I [Actinomycetota bacterium]|nr:cytochrome ubiquinol oxidase subunit I [Actinomycetota bacterium]
MSALDLSRWQFGITTVYHFIFVPLTIGLAFVLAIMQTLEYKTKKPVYGEMVKFFGRLFAVNFAIGLVTGIVQEFQFGMNWSSYSIFVGNIFGAPLAIEGLLAFFLESTFLGTWLFGKHKVSVRVHLFSAWMVSVGTILSALFILAANSFMQHPVGYAIDPKTHQAVMTNFLALLTNSTLITTFFHTVLAAFSTGAGLVLGVAAYQILRYRKKEMFVGAARIGIVVLFVSMLFNAFVGHIQGQIMEKQQPMKMAAAEALYNTSSGASFSLLTIGNLSGDPIFQIRLPHLLSVLSDNSWNGTVQGINQVQAAEVAKYGAGSYVPPIWVEYWTFRIMVGLGGVILLWGLVGLYFMRQGSLDRKRWYLRISPYLIAAPIIANLTGWIFTEVGRQPWIVYGLLKTSNANSHLSALSVGITLVGFTAVYSILAVVDGILMFKFGSADPDSLGSHGEKEPEDSPTAHSDLIY